MHQNIHKLPASLQPHPLLITKDEFLKQYQPIINAINPGSPLGGLLYACEGPEFDILCSHDPSLIWSLRQGDGGLLLISSGFMLQETLGHIVTRIKHDTNLTIEVVLDPFVLFRQFDLKHKLSRLSCDHQLSQEMQMALAVWNDGYRTDDRGV